MKGMFNILENWKNIGMGVIKNLKMAWIISRQIADSPPPQQGTSDSISRLTSFLP